MVQKAQESPERLGRLELLTDVLNF